MADSTLTRERILEAAEDVLRRFGPTKTTVVDVARALGVSHGSVYRHFPSKSALRDAVTEQWLARISAPLEAIVNANAAPPRRLRQWFDTLISAKRERAFSDPELFATYIALVSESRAVVRAHVETLVAQVTRILTDGVKQGLFRLNDPALAAQSMFYATARFHDPVHSADWSDPSIGAAFEGVWALLMRGLEG